MVRDFKSALRASSARQAATMQAPTFYPATPLELKTDYELLYQAAYSVEPPVPGSKLTEQQWRFAAAQVPCRNSRTGCKELQPQVRSQASGMSETLATLRNMFMRAKGSDIPLTMLHRQGSGWSSDASRHSFEIEDARSSDAGIAATNARQCPPSRPGGPSSDAGVAATNARQCHDGADSGYCHPR